jgi:hypothetical protein
MTVDLHEYAEGSILLDGLETAIVGIVEEFGNGNRILYSKTKILYILQKRDDMTYEEAEEFYDYNIIGGYFGERNPVFLDLSVTPVITDNGFEFNINSYTEPL